MSLDLDVVLFPSNLHPSTLLKQRPLHPPPPGWLLSFPSPYRTDMFYERKKASTMGFQKG